MIKRRMARLRRRLKKDKLDGLVVTLPANRRYLSGFTPDDGQWGESSGALLIGPGCAYLLTDFRYQLTAQAQATYFETRIYKKGLAVELAALLPELGLKRLGFESEGLLVSQHAALAKELGDKAELVATREMVSKLRRIKDRSEVAELRRAIGLMEEVLSAVMAGTLAGRSERQVAQEIVRRIEEAGGDGPAFDPIVASGPNAAEPHAEPGERVIAEGEMVLFDVGATVHGYHSDMSRTVIAGGVERADEKFRQVYSAVQSAQAEARDKIRPGMTGKQADAIARQVIDQAGFKGKFGHSLGHGVGLATHEAPSVGPLSDDKLEPGMVFTIEPGIYLAGWGGVRLEDMVLLQEDGCQLLSRLDGKYHFS